MTNHVKGLEPLEELLSRWKESEIKHYKPLKEEYEKTVNQYKEYQKLYGEKVNRNTWTPEAIQLHNKLYGTNQYWDERKLKGYERKLIQCYTMDEIIKDIDKEMEIQYQAFIKKVEAKGGKIVEVIRCSWNGKGNIDGLIKCDKNTVSIDTIIAGGYNIQRLHYRTLINVWKG